MASARTLCAIAALALLTTACGNGDGVAEELEGLDGAQVTVGSKEFSEQVILGQMMIQALEAAGAQVNDQTSLAGTLVLREALEGDEIDLYWEYTGTAWTDIFGEEDVIEDPDELLSTVAERDEENGIVWGERGSFENAYAIATNEQIADEYGIGNLTELSELTHSDPDVSSICVAEEFATRADGLPGMQAHYDMNEEAQEGEEPLDEGIIYTYVGDESDPQCNFGVVFTTDGRIGAQDLVVLEDDDSFFPEYNPAITVRDEVAEEYPEIVELADEIISRIDVDQMIELNLQADEQGLPHDEIAEEWLTEEGFL